MKIEVLCDVPVAFSIKSRVISMTVIHDVTTVSPFDILIVNDFTVDLNMPPILSARTNDT